MASRQQHLRRRLANRGGRAADPRAAGHCRDAGGGGTESSEHGTVRLGSDLEIGQKVRILSGPFAETLCRTRASRRQRARSRVLRIHGRGSLCAPRPITRCASGLMVRRRRPQSKTRLRTASVRKSGSRRTSRDFASVSATSSSSSEQRKWSFDRGCLQRRLIDKTLSIETARYTSTQTLLGPRT